MKKYEKIKTELVKQGVKLDGFGVWLKVRNYKEKLGITMSMLGQFPHERKWERVYLQLKDEVDIDIDRFSDWLIGLPEFRTNGFGAFVENGFTSIGNGITEIGKSFGKIFGF